MRKQDQSPKQNKSPNILYALGGLAIGAIGMFLGKEILDAQKQQDSQITQTQQQQQPTPINYNPNELTDVLVCPITAEIIQDAAQLNTCGHTFEKVALEQWLDKHETCPQCRLPAKKSNVIKNYALQQVLDQYRTNK